MKLLPVPSVSSFPTCSTRNPTLRRFIVPLLFVFLAAFTAGAQKKGDLQLRVVRGTVLDKDENPAPFSYCLPEECEITGGQDVYCRR